MRSVPGATPLASLDAVVFDTETTGLDTAKARIIEIGGIKIDAGRLDDATFCELVDPGQPIPPASTAIHGITDDMVKGRSPFAAALAAFTVFHRGRVLVGHSIGFDFAVIGREAERAGMKYTRPRSLCIRVLGQIANPNLPDHSLDMLAGWLGVPIADRHRALGDARATAAVFLAMVPALAKKGIRTLAEAERASAAMTREIERHQRAGWADPVVRPGEAAAAGRVDPYAYRHRVRDVMSSPPICVAAATTVKQVIDLMAERKISAVFISADGAPGGNARDYGVVTERHMLRIVSERGADAFSLPIGPLASRPLVGVEADAFVYRAVARMNRLKLRHLAVNSDTGLLQGIVTSRDLLKLRASAAIALDDAIDVSLSAAEMGRAFARCRTWRNRSWTKGWKPPSSPRSSRRKSAP
ncbi:MAG: CBS domain-containing protein [Phyllobacteriaceae bacterium]|nr:CBS domain-containing protein [Phyllobacteriaceae bacterium]